MKQEENKRKRMAEGGEGKRKQGSLNDEEAKEAIGQAENGLRGEENKGTSSMEKPSETMARSSAAWVWRGEDDGEGTMCRGTAIRPGEQHWQQHHHSPVTRTHAHNCA